MNVKLITDFRDYYDHQFDLYGDDMQEFRRISTEGPDKREQLETLQIMGFKTPLFGTVTELADQFKARPSWSDSGRFSPNDFFKVVVYDDLTKHCGLGKQLLTLHDALEYCPHAFASEYIQADLTGGVKSWRWLQVGDQPFLLEYSSDDLWRSNCGEVKVTILNISPYKMIVPVMKYPLWAIDYVTLNDGEIKFAIDFNCAPGIKGTGVEDIMSSNDVVLSIKKAMYVLNQ